MYKSILKINKSMVIVKRGGSMGCNEKCRFNKGGRVCSLKFTLEKKDYVYSIIRKTHNEFSSLGSTFGCLLIFKDDSDFLSKDIVYNVTGAT